MRSMPSRSFPVSSRRPLLGIVLVLALVAAGCSSDGGGTPTQPEPFSLTVSAETSAISLFGETRLTARALRSGAPVAPGTEVVLSTSFGRLDAQNLLADADGRVTTTLRGIGGSGTATVTARLGGTSVTATTAVTIGLGLVLDLRADPSVINSDGNAQLLATLSNDGSPVAGTQIQLETSLGRLVNPTPRTNSLGNASTTLSGNGASGTAVVTATATGIAQPARVEVRIGSLLRLSLLITPTTLPVDGSALVTATVRRFDGSPTGSGRVVRLSTDLGRLDRTDPITNAQGMATTTLRGDGRAGTARVEAQVDGADGTEFAFVTLGGNARLTLTASPPAIPATGTSTLTAVLSDANGGAIAGSQIQFTTTLGRIDGDRQTTNAQGLATTRLVGEGLTGTARVTATATAAGASSVVDVVLQ